MTQFDDLELASRVRAKVADAIDVGLQRMDRTEQVSFLHLPLHFTRILLTV